MSKFLRHEPCEKCGSSDAKGVFDDGHTYCWSCNGYKPSEITSGEQAASILLLKSQGAIDKNNMSLPLDISKDIPKLPYQWLKGYGVTNEEMQKHGLLWSESRQMLIFPFYGEEATVLCWQGRYFPARFPKVFTAGYPDKYTLMYYNGNTINSSVCLVEDCISAILVARRGDSAPLFGSNLSTHKAIGLSRLYKKLIIWLDADKYATAVTLANKFSVLFEEVKVIYTEKDPKEYSTEEIRKYLYAT